MTLKVKVNDPIFNTSWEYPRMHVWCKFVDSSSNLWWFITRTRRISLNSNSKCPKWPIKSGSITSIFNTKWEYPMIHVFANLGIRVEICDELSCGKGNLTDGLTDRRTDTGNDISPSAWKPMGKNRTICHAKNTWKLSWSVKQVRLLYPLNPCNLAVTASLST